MINLEKTFDQLFPICRSITGAGYRQSFNLIKTCFLTLGYSSTVLKVVNMILKKIKFSGGLLRLF